MVLVVLASNSLTSGSTPNAGAARFQVASPGTPGFPSQTPSRALNTVSRNVIARDASGPMFELTAAPDVVSASPSVIPEA